MKRMHWSDICSSYPNEWVAIADETRLGDLPYDDVEGMVVAHASDDNVFATQINNLPSNIHDLDIRFTGDVLPDNPIGPVLWRISDSPS